MELKNAIDFANKVSSCAMATLQEGEPRVRMMGLWFASKEGFYFQAWTWKEVDKQLRKNPKIEVCFFSSDKKDPFSMMRVRGEVEFLDDISYREKVLKDRPFLLDLGAKGPQDETISIFKISKGEISFWAKGKIIEKIKF